MRQHIANLMKNELFLLMMNGVFAYTAFTAVVIMTLNVPPDAILDSGLDQILLVFDEFP